VPGDIHNGLIASAALGEFGDQRMPGIVEAAAHARALPSVSPCRLERSYRPCWVKLVRPTEWEQVPVRLNSTEADVVPL